jgi:hypothetical protein
MGACASKHERRGSVRPQGTLAEAATTPLADINFKKVPIPDVLQRAVANPYDPHGVETCHGIAAEVARLDDALGPDADEPPPLDDRSNMERTANTAHSAAVTVVREGVKSAVPFRGWIRQLSGAAREEREVQAAINAGSTRRGYLKGVGMRLDCAPPAAPSWFRPQTARQSTRSGPTRR